MKKFLTDEEVRAEIEKLKGNPDVKLARAEQRVKNRERQRLYSLRYLAKRGAELRESGITEETLAAMERECDEDIAAIQAE